MEWIKIFPSEVDAKAALAEGKPRLLVIDDERICLVAYKEKFYAVQDACTHNGESLSKGSVNYLGEIICPWHNYRFALADGVACDSSCRDLKTYPLRVDESGFFIGI